MKRSRLSPLAVTLLVAAAITAPGCRALYDFARGYGETSDGRLTTLRAAELSQVDRGAAYFAIFDFGALNTDAIQTHAVPWRLVAAALVLRARESQPGLPISQASLRDILRKFGFLFPDTVNNWPTTLAQPASGAPLGLTRGTIRRTIPALELEVANLGCAACHSGVTWSATGDPDPRHARLGSPNTSLNLEAYTLAIYDAFKVVVREPDTVLAATRELFPQMSEREEKTLRRFVLPRLRDAMAGFARSGDRPAPFSNGSPGVTNGVAALKAQLEVEDASLLAAESGFTSIPDLGFRTWRTALLCDGAYSAPSQPRPRPFEAKDVSERHIGELAAIVTFFSVPSMGVHPDRARENLPQAIDVMQFLNAYRPQRYPTSIDTTLARAGSGVYSQACAKCHGTYDDNLESPGLLSFPNWIGPFDTDPTRWQAFDAPLLRAISRTSYRDIVHAASTRSYAAPPLTGLWASAPYLHNGSVPTLHQLMHPGERPARFMVGGHRLNLQTVGIDGQMNSSGNYVYPESYVPWSSPLLIDTARRGLSNRGHEAEFTALSEQQKSALLEYLKAL